MNQIELPAGTIHLRSYGPPDGRPVVFVHGFLVDDTLWSDVPERLAARGFRTFAPSWPLGAHRTAMKPGADLSPRGQARVVLSFLEALDLRDVVLVGSDTGGAVCQFLLDEDDARIGRLVLTNCDAFETFPPAPFGLLVKMCASPGAGRVVLQSMRSARLRNGKFGFGGLVRRRLGAEESLTWVRPYLENADVRRDVATLARGWDRTELLDVATRLPAFDKPVLLCWGQSDPFFKPELGRRLAATFPQARLVELPGMRTFVSLDQPGRVADEIAGFAAS